MKNVQKDEQLDTLNNFISKLWQGVNDQQIKINNDEEFDQFADNISKNFYMQNLCLNQICNYMVAQKQNFLCDILKKLFFLQHVYIKKISQIFYNAQNDEDICEKENLINQNNFKQKKNKENIQHNKRPVQRVNNKVQFLFQSLSQTEIFNLDEQKEDSKQKKSNLLSDEYIYKKADELYNKWENDGVFPSEEFNPVILTVVCKKIMEKILRRSNNNKELLDNILGEINPLQFEESKFEEIQHTLNNIYRHLKIDIPNKILNTYESQIAKNPIKQKSIETYVVDIINEAEQKILQKFKKYLVVNEKDKILEFEVVGTQTKQSNQDINEVEQLLKSEQIQLKQQINQMSDDLQQKDVQIDLQQKQINKQQDQLQKYINDNSKLNEQLKILQNKNKELVQKTREFQKLVDFQKLYQSKFDKKFLQFQNGIDIINQNISNVFSDNQDNNLSEEIQEGQQDSNLQLRIFENKFDKLQKITIKIANDYKNFNNNSNHLNIDQRNDNFFSKIFENVIKSQQNLAQKNQRKYQIKNQKIFFQNKSVNIIPSEQQKQNFQGHLKNKVFSQQFQPSLNLIDPHQSANEITQQNKQRRQSIEIQHKQNDFINNIQKKIKQAKCLSKNSEIINQQNYNQSLQSNNILKFQEKSYLEKMNLIELQQYVAQRYSKNDLNKINPHKKQRTKLNRKQSILNKKLASFYQIKKASCSNIQQSQSQHSNILLKNQSISNSLQHIQEKKNQHNIKNQLKKISQSNFQNQKQTQYLNINSFKNLQRGYQIQQLSEYNVNKVQKIDNSIQFLIHNLKVKRKNLQNQNKDQQVDLQLHQIDQFLLNLEQIKTIDFRSKQKVTKSSNNNLEQNTKQSQKQLQNESIRELEQIESARDNKLIFQSKELRDTQQYLCNDSQNAKIDKELKKLKETIFLLKIEQQKNKQLADILDLDLINEEKKQLTYNIFQLFKQKNLKLKKFPILTNQIFIIIDKFYAEHQKCFQFKMQNKFYQELKNFVKFKLKKTLINLPKIKFDKNYNFPNFKGKFHML